MNFYRIIDSKTDKPFKLFFWRFFFGYLPFGLLISFLALFDIKPVVFNEEPLIGVKGFFLGILMIPLIVLAITIVVWLLFKLGDLIIKALIEISENK